MDPELEYDGDWERIHSEEDRQKVHDAFHSIIVWHAGMCYILDDGIFDSNGSILLIQGEY